MDVAPAYYSVSCVDLTKILRKHIKSLKRSELEKIYSELEKHSDYTLTNPPTKIRTIKRNIVPDEKKQIQGLFFINGKSYKYFKLLIDMSKIEGAGYGVYAVDEIPKGARAWYRGEHKMDGYAKNEYSWKISSFDYETGEADDEEEIYTVDAFDKTKSNWTRYVNCGPSRKSNNFNMVQFFDRVFYVANRNIKPGEELYVDYGKDYRRDNLGMKKKY